jgi:transposase
MTRFVGLDVSQKMTVICVVDDAGDRLWWGQCPTIPEQITVLVRRQAGDDARIRIETGAMTPWLVRELRNLGLEVVCLDARHARAALKMQINKTDQNDAEGLARSHRVVPVCSCQVVRKPPCACSSGRKDSAYRHDDAIVQPHPGGAQKVRPSTRRDHRSEG